jgi:hypothetical protein
MSKNTQRLSQTVSTFGPGAMMDLPSRSVVVGGLNQWEMRTTTVISEPRATTKLERLLKDQNRLAEGVKLQLRVPPVSDSGTFGAPDGIRCFIFPKWFVCERTEAGSTPADRRRRLVPWQDLAANGRRRYCVRRRHGNQCHADPLRLRLRTRTPSGHRLAPRGSWSGSVPMWIEEKGTSAAAADTAVICGCGKRLSLRDLCFRQAALASASGRGCLTAIQTAARKNSSCSRARPPTRTFRKSWVTGTFRYRRIDRLRSGRPWFLDRDSLAVLSNFKWPSSRAP